MIVRARTPYYTAVQWTGDNLAEMTAFLGAALIEHCPGALDDAPAIRNTLLIWSRSGRQHMRQGEWAVHLNFHVYDIVSPAVFGALYEEVPQ